MLVTLVSTLAWAFRVFCRNSWRHTIDAGPLLIVVATRMVSLSAMDPLLDSDRIAFLDEQPVPEPSANNIFDRHDYRRTGQLRASRAARCLANPIRPSLLPSCSSVNVLVDREPSPGGVRVARA